MRISRRENRKLNLGVFIVLVFGFLLFPILSVASRWFQNRGSSISIKKLLVFLLIGTTGYFLLSNSANAQNSSLYLSPSSGQIVTGQTFSLVLRVNTGGTAINAAEGSIVFDQSKLSVVSISKSGSIFTIWATDPKFSNAEGEIEFAGGVPNPGYSGSNGLILTITFRAKTATTVRGSTEINLVSGAILANDGLGTNILSSLGRAEYSISPSVIPPVEPTEKERETPARVVEGVPLLKSTTHPDQNKWYSNNDPVFEWDVPDPVKEVRLLIGKKPLATPQIKYSPPISQKVLEDLTDGIWYFHAQFVTARGLGEAAHFKLQIDTKPPKSFNISRQDADDAVNPQPELFFETSDDGDANTISGLDRYEIKIVQQGSSQAGEAEWVKIETSLVANKAYKLPLQTPGDYLVKIRAYDKANNFSEDEYALKIDSIEVPILVYVPEKVRLGGKFNVSGTAKSGYEVNVFLVSGERVGAQAKTPVDNRGDWTAEIDASEVAKGRYEIYARAVDNRGAISNKSNILPITIIAVSVWKYLLDALSKGFDNFINFLINGWLLIVIAWTSGSLLYLLLKKLVPHVEREIKRARDFIKEYKAAKQLETKGMKTHREIKKLNASLEKGLRWLRKLKKQKGLTPNEKKLKSRIERHIKLLKSF